ncbi:MAG TPA: carbon-nitrogen hydrolase family protein [Candidatus Hydrogenedentes bacterium]|nr:carbon-nitrogen hydrolase family protein [Candidatus Hydrogenedentota bacterium]
MVTVPIYLLLAGLAVAQAEPVGRPVHVVSIGFSRMPLDNLVSLVEKEAAQGADLIVLPETCTGNTNPETVDGKTVKSMGELAKKYHTYIACAMDRMDGDKRLNSVVLLDREGNVAGIYNKVFPFWSEYDLKPPVNVGEDAPVFQADFGKIGFAICFDANFPEVWQRLGDQGAELVLFCSAYSAGMSLQAQAITNHYYIVSSTLRADCHVFDITGELLLYEKSSDINVSRVTLDLDRCIFHQDYNMPQREKLLKEHADDIFQEKWLDREAWFVFKAKRPGVSARALAQEYGMEELRDYVARSRYQIDQKRGCPFWEKVVKEQVESSKQRFPEK